MEITFIPASKEVEMLTEGPIPAKKVVPDWYKKNPAFDSKNPQFENNQISNTSIKMCMPFFDATTGGYVQRTWTDIFIGKQNDSLIYHFAQLPQIMSHRDKVSVELSSSYYPIEYIWTRQWTAKLPKGYSLLITHPHNRLDLPFTTMSGLVDADEFFHTPVGNIPFYVREGFSGFIPAGTPMYQMIPVKRDNWTSKVEPFDEIKTTKLNYQMRRHFYGAYRNMFWNKKHYD